jgi:hypothetical protein
MSSLNRRAFLSQSLAAAAATGMPLISWASEGGAAKAPASGPPNPAQAEAALANEPWRLALERMKAENKPGIVFLLPSDAEQAAKLTVQLQNWLADGPVSPKFARILLSLDQNKAPGCQVVERPPIPKDPVTRQLLTQAVFACAPRRSGDAKGRPAAEAVVLLLAPDGKTIVEASAKEMVEGKFGDRLADFFHGEKDERLAERCRAEREALGADETKKVAAAIEALDSDEFAVREEGQAGLKPLAPKIMALLTAALRDKPSVEKGRRLEQLFDTMYEEATSKKPAALLPYGVRWQLQQRDPCPGCGLGSAPPPARKFLALLTQPTSVDRG